MSHKSLKSQISQISRIILGITNYAKITKIPKIPYITNQFRFRTKKGHITMSPLVILVSNVMSHIIDHYGSDSFTLSTHVTHICFANII